MDVPVRHDLIAYATSGSHESCGGDEWLQGKILRQAQDKDGFGRTRVTSKQQSAVRDRSAYSWDRW